MRDFPISTAHELHCPVLRILGAVIRMVAVVHVQRSVVAKPLQAMSWSSICFQLIEHLSTNAVSVPKMSDTEVAIQALTALLVLGASDTTRKCTWSLPGLW